MYEQLRQLRNELLYPDGVPFEKYCQVITDQYKHLGEMTLIKPDYKTKQGDWMVLLNGNTLYQNESEFKNLGKEVTIADILRMLNKWAKKCPKGVDFIIETCDVWMGITYMIGENDFDGTLSFDLAKPIKDQDLNQLIELIR